MAITDDENIYSDFAYDIEDLIDSEEGPTLNIISFIDRELELGIELTRQQKLILKCVYNIALEPEDKEILEDWKERDRTTWSSDQWYQTLVCEGGRRAGKCISTENSYVYTDKGILSLKEFTGESEEGDWVSNNIKVSSGTNQNQVSTHFYNNGYKQVKELKTKLGYTLAGVPEHRVKVIDTDGILRWKYFSELQHDDYIALSKGPDIWSKEYQPFAKTDISGKGFNQRNYNASLSPKYLTEDYAYLLGLMVGDGTWNSKNVSISGLQEDLLIYKEYLETFFDGTLKIRKNKKRTETLLIGNSLLKEAYDKVGYIAKERDSKVIPDIILKSPKSVVANFLRGLFDTDGFISKDGKEISVSTSCKSLAKQLQIVLLNFGLVTSIRTKVLFNKEYYNVSIIGLENRRRFAKDIGFTIPRKAERLKVLENPQKEGGYFLRIPYQKSWLQKLRSKIPQSYGEFLRKSDGTGLNGRKASNADLKTQLKKIVGNCIKTGCKEELSYSKLVKLNRWLEETGLAESYKEIYQHFLELEQLNYFFDKIDSFEEYKCETGDLCVPENRTYVANGIVSHNTSIISVLAAYEFYKLCKLESPQEYYKIAKSTPISILVIATTYDQSKNVTFKNIIGTVRSSRYLKRLEDNGEIVIGLEEIKHEKKMIYVRPGNSKSGSQVGGTLKALILDEVARFENKEGKSNADEIWTNLGAALTTFRENALKVAISSAWEEGDAIYNLFERSRNATSTVGFRLRSKDLNPIHGGDDNPVVKDAFETDTEQAYLEYYGIRPSIQNAFLDENLIDRSFTGLSRIYAKPTQRQTKSGEYLSCLEVSSIEEQQHYSSSIVHLDPALSGDFYGFAIGHSEFDEDERLIVVIDAVLAWEGTRKVNVDFGDVYNVIEKINKVRPIEYISADRWNSGETLQRIKDLGIKTEAFKFSNSQQYDFYSSLKKVINEDRLVLPKNSRWRALLERELKQVQLLKGAKIDHPETGSKDLSDCVAVVVHHLNERTLQDKVAQNNFEPSPVKRFNTKPRTKAIDKAPVRKNHFRKEWNRIKSKF